MFPNKFYRVGLSVVVGGSLLIGLAWAVRAALLASTPVYMPIIVLQPTSTLTQTLTPTPTATPTNTPTATPTTAAPAWLSRLNMYRSLAGLAVVSENVSYSTGNQQHACYTVKNDILDHAETPGLPCASTEGAAAAINSNLAATTKFDETDEWALDGWMQAPFHAVSMLDPKLLQTGYGSYREADGGIQMSAGMDVLRGRGNVPNGTIFPIFWPGNGSVSPLSLHTNESPDPLSSCPGYVLPTGLPLVIQLGTGSVTPNVTAHSFQQGATSLDHCVFDETTYVNSDSDFQNVGRNILGARDTVVLIPRNPLVAGATYVASLTVNGQTYTWSFSVASDPFDQ